MELGLEVVWGNACGKPGARYLYVPLLLLLLLRYGDLCIHIAWGLLESTKFATLPGWCWVFLSSWDSSGGRGPRGRADRIISYGSLLVTVRNSKSSWGSPLPLEIPLPSELCFLFLALRRMASAGFFQFLSMDFLLPFFLLKWQSRAVWVAATGHLWPENKTLLSTQNEWSVLICQVQ